MLREKYFIGLILWLFFSFIGANASGNLYGHQIKQIMPALSIIIAILLTQTTIGFDKKLNSFKKNIAVLIVSIIIISIPYNNLIINGYFNGFPEPEKELGLWIKENSTKQDYIYIVSYWGSGQVLSYSERVSSSKYFNLIFVKTDYIKEILLKDLENNQPKYLIVSSNYGEKWIAPYKKFMSEYSFLFSHDSYNVYLLNSK